MKIKFKKLKNLTNKSPLPTAQTPHVAGGKHIEVTNYRQCFLSEGIWGCTGGACQD